MYTVIQTNPGITVCGLIIFNLPLLILHRPTSVSLFHAILFIMSENNNAIIVGPVEALNDMLHIYNRVTFNIIVAYLFFFFLLLRKEYAKNSSGKCPISQAALDKQPHTQAACAFVVIYASGR